MNGLTLSGGQERLCRQPDCRAPAMDKIGKQAVGPTSIHHNARVADEKIEDATEDSVDQTVAVTRRTRDDSLAGVLDEPQRRISELSVEGGGYRGRAEHEGTEGTSRPQPTITTSLTYYY